MQTTKQLEQGFVVGPPLATDRATVHLIVLRKGDGVHATPPTAKLHTDGGIEGDRWAAGDKPDPRQQVTLMRVDIAKLVTIGQPLHLPGDNFLVDLDLSEAALPVGTRIALGTAVLEVSDKPHRGCKKFAGRFGVAAVRWINKKVRRSLRLRGVNCRIVSGGEVRLGDDVIVL